LTEGVNSVLLILFGGYLIIVVVAYAAARYPYRSLYLVPQFLKHQHPVKSVMRILIRYRFLIERLSP